MQEKTVIEHFKETDWLGFYVGDAGTIINQTGCKLVKYFCDEEVYVGIEAHKKRYMRKLSTLVYQFHIRQGKKLPDDLIVKFKDNDPKNCSTTNLLLSEKKGKAWFESRSSRQVAVV